MGGGGKRGVGVVGSRKKDSRDSRGVEVDILQKGGVINAGRLRSTECASKNVFTCGEAWLCVREHTGVPGKRRRAKVKGRKQEDRKLDRQTRCENEVSKESRGESQTNSTSTI